MFASGIPITMVGLDVTHKALFTRAHAERLREAGRAGRFVAELSDFFQRVPRALATASTARRSTTRWPSPTSSTRRSLTTRRANVAVETRSEFCDGRTVVDLRGVTRRASRTRTSGVDVDAERFLELLVSRIASLP